MPNVIIFRSLVYVADVNISAKFFAADSVRRGEEHGGRNDTDEKQNTENSHDHLLEPRATLAALDVGIVNI